MMLATFLFLNRKGLYSSHYIQMMVMRVRMPYRDVYSFFFYSGVNGKITLSWMGK